MSRLSVGTIQGTAGSGNVITIPSGHSLISTDLGGIYVKGTVVQVVNTIKTDTFTMAGTTPLAVTGLAVSITPKYANSKIVIQGIVQGQGQSASTQMFVHLAKNGTLINTVAVAGSGQLATCIGRYYVADANISGQVPFFWSDSPGSTGTYTFQVYVSAESAGTIYVNRTQNDSAVVNGSRAVSSISAWEVCV